MVALPKPFPLIFISVDGSCARAKQNLLFLENMYEAFHVFRKSYNLLHKQSLPICCNGVPQTHYRWV